MSRLAVAGTAALCSAAVTLAVAPRDGAGARAAAPTPTTLKVGDQVTVQGQPLGCRIASRGGHPVVDCRRGGQLAGTYGTILSAHRALVVRYRSNSVAKVVFTATHRGGARRCE
ncbi:MAG TPA: hypothetical protein VI318_22010 [Baekduia sp.]